MDLGQEFRRKVSAEQNKTDLHTDRKKNSQETKRFELIQMFKGNTNTHKAYTEGGKTKKKHRKKALRHTHTDSDGFIHGHIDTDRSDLTNGQTKNLISTPILVHKCTQAETDSL